MKKKFTDYTKLFMLIPAALVLAALILNLAGHGLNLGIDFTGGSLLEYAVGEEFNTEDVVDILRHHGYTDAQVAAYAAVGGLPYLDNTDTVFGQVYAGMEVVDAMACVDTVKDDDGNATFRPTEEAAITINHVTITTYTAEADNGLDTVG